MSAPATAPASVKRTPLYDLHRELGAKLIDFGGWEMPVQYSGIMEEHRAVRDCLDALPPEKRAAVLGRFYADLEYGELAAATGEKTDTVRIRVGRALPDLRECLERKGGKL